MGVRIPDPQVIKISQQDLWKYKDAYLKAGEKGGAFARIHYHEDGSINEEWTYNKTYIEKLHGKENIDNSENEADSSKTNENESDSSKTNEKEGCLTKIIKLLLKGLWWLTKKILVVLSLGILSSFLEDDK